MRGHRRIVGAVASAVIALALVGCAPESDEDCDAEDLRNREAECGYYDGDTWVLYPWVAPGVGGKPASGQKPKAAKNPPKGGNAPAQRPAGGRR